MIRLIHQFDDPRARATVASPTVAACCCCCCCCCIVTTISACALTSRAVGKGLDRLAASAPAPAREIVPEANFREPAVRDVPAARMRPDKTLWMLFAFITPLLALAAVVGGVWASDAARRAYHVHTDWLPFVTSLGTWAALSVLLYRATRANRLFLALLPLVWAVLSVGEAALWIACLKN